MWPELAIVFFVTLIVRFYSIMAGGGRMVLIPLLTVFLGLDPSIAVATMKCGGLSSFVSLFTFHKHKKINWKLWRKITPFAIAGVSIGTYVVINIDQEIFNKLLSISIAIALVIMLLFKRKATQNNDEKEIGFGTYVASFISGLFGAAFGFKGMIMRYLYVSKGLTFLEATATNKATSLIGNLISITSFIVVSLVNWPVAVTMLIGGGIGSWLGAHVSIKIGSVWVERIFIFAIIMGVILMFLEK